MNYNTYLYDTKTNPQNIEYLLSIISELNQKDFNNKLDIFFNKLNNGSFGSDTEFDRYKSLVTESFTNTKTYQNITDSELKNNLDDLIFDYLKYNYTV